MLKRAWFLVCAVWGLFFLLNGVSKVDGPLAGDYALAAAPLLIGLFLWQGVVFVARGTPPRSGAAPAGQPIRQSSESGPRRL